MESSQVLNTLYKHTKTTFGIEFSFENIISSSYCFVVDLPAFNVLRQFTSGQAFNSIYLLLKYIYIYIWTVIWENRA